MENLRDLLLEELKDLYSAENQIVKALPKIIDEVETDELKDALSDHLEATKDQVARLDQVFSLMGEKPKAKHCAGMEGLLREGEQCLSEQEKGQLRDLQLIGAAQRVEHYEVAAYGTAKAIAKRLSQNDTVELLDETLKEEEEADEKLTDVAEAIYDEISGLQDNIEETAAPPRRKAATVK